MTGKWADYLISAVRYNTAETHIEEVRVHEDEGDNVGAGSTWLRASVIANLEAGYTFMTITEGSGTGWRKGATVDIVIVRGTKYIRTDADATAEDNLGSLPKF
ncbi:MAG TPA: DUF3892 domain-containing protein [Solirubrobacterales bacterium]|nr:DUF3892 domain-containing protein [Solirubrobacterales bacterium]